MQSYNHRTIVQYNIIYQLFSEKSYSIFLYTITLDFHNIKKIHLYIFDRRRRTKKSSFHLVAFIHKIIDQHKFDFAVVSIYYLGRSSFIYIFTLCGVIYYCRVLENLWEIFLFHVYISILFIIIIIIYTSQLLKSKLSYLSYYIMGNNVQKVTLGA